MFCAILTDFAHPDVMPTGCPSGSSSTTSRGSCLPSFTILATIKGKPPQPAGEAACRSSPSSTLLKASRHNQPGKLPAGSVRTGSFPLRVPFWLSFIPSGAYYTPGTGVGHTRHSSARRAVSRLNRSCRNELIGGITLIVNYLYAPLGRLLQVDMQSKILILSYLQG